MDEKQTPGRNSCRGLPSMFPTASGAERGGSGATTSTSTAPTPARPDSSQLGSFFFTQVFPLALLQRLCVTGEETPQAGYEDPHDSAYSVSGEDQGACATLPSRKSVTEESRDLPSQGVDGETRPSPPGYDGSASASTGNPAGSSGEPRQGSSVTTEGGSSESSNVGEVEGESTTRQSDDGDEQHRTDRDKREYRTAQLFSSESTGKREEEESETHLESSCCVSRGAGKDGGFPLSLPRVRTPPLPTCVAVRGNFVAVGSSEGVIVLLRWAGLDALVHSLSLLRSPSVCDIAFA